MTERDVKSFLKEDVGYSLGMVSRVTNIPSSTLYRWSNAEESAHEYEFSHRCDYTEVVEEIRGILSEHPYFGYRRVHAHLKHREKRHITKHTVYRLMREHGLLQKRWARRKKVPNSNVPEVDGPDQMWQIDMTYSYTESGVPVYTVGVIDVYTRSIRALKGFHRARATEWLDALDEAIKEVFPEGKAEGLVLGSDNGCQPTSKNFRKTCGDLNISIHYTGYKNPKENGYIERFFRTLKEECLWLNDFEGYDDYCRELDNFKEYYNERRMHSSLGYKSPREFEMQENLCYA